MKNKEIAIIGLKQDVQDMEHLFSKYLIEKNNMYTIFIVSDIANKKYPDSFSEVICEPDKYDCLDKNICNLVKNEKLDMTSLISNTNNLGKKIDIF
jgi:hypothetical protein